MHVPQGQFVLHRRPLRRNELLRAWDAADEYLLSEVAKRLPSESGKDTRILIVNDSFGALAVALSSWSPQTWSDSLLSQLATRDNCRTNDIDLSTITEVDSLKLPIAPLDVVLIRVPKTLALLEDQLIKLRPLLTSDTQVFVAGMVKALPRSVWPMLETLLGAVQTMPAVKKAKLIGVTPDLTRPLSKNPYPVIYPLEGTDWLISNHANVFSRNSLDIGTRFFLEHLPYISGARDIVDLGCGNGVVGLKSASQHSNATVHFVDESFMAVASAKENIERAFGAAHRAAFHVSDGLEGFAPASVDLVLCNPPFHQQHAVGDQIAKRFFRQVHTVLRPGGELWVIGNRHLGYHVTLKRLFGNADVVASNAKFVILRAVRRST